MAVEKLLPIHSFSRSGIYCTEIGAAGNFFARASVIPPIGNSAAVTRHHDIDVANHPMEEKPLGESLESFLDGAPPLAADIAVGEHGGGNAVRAAITEHPALERCIVAADDHTGGVKPSEKFSRRGAEPPPLYWGVGIAKEFVWGDGGNLVEDVTARRRGKEYREIFNVALGIKRIHHLHEIMVGGVLYPHDPRTVGRASRSGILNKFASHGNSTSNPGHQPSLIGWRWPYFSQSSFSREARRGSPRRFGYGAAVFAGAPEGPPRHAPQC